MSNIFEKASRAKLRFPSIKGEITVEQLWDLPLQSKTSFDLDTVAKTVNADLKQAGEESFVSTTSNPGKERLELSMEIVKHVIATRLAENDIARQAVARQEERRRLQEILAQKKDENLKAMDVADIEKRLAELDAS